MSFERNLLFLAPKLTGTAGETFPSLRGNAMEHGKECGRSLLERPHCVDAMFSSRETRQDAASAYFFGSSFFASSFFGSGFALTRSLRVFIMFSAE